MLLDEGICSLFKSRAENYFALHNIEIYQIVMRALARVCPVERRQRRRKIGFSQLGAGSDTCKIA